MAFDWTGLITGVVGTAGTVVLGMYTTDAQSDLIDDENERQATLKERLAAMSMNLSAENRKLITIGVIVLGCLIILFVTLKLIKKK